MFFRQIFVGSLVFASVLATAGVVSADEDFGAADGIRSQAICQDAATNMTLHKGHYGVDVQTVQVLLGITPADGCFGDQTHTAVEDFQSCHGLYVDGIVGPATWRALNAGKSLTGCARGVATQTTPVVSGERRIVIDQWKEVVRLKVGESTIDTMPMIDNHHVLSKGTYQVCEFIRENRDFSNTWRLPNFVRLCKEDGTRTGKGFHAIPVRISTGEVMHDDSFLGTGEKQSSGCNRLSLVDSQILWDFAKLGMEVVVI